MSNVDMGEVERLAALYRQERLAKEQAIDALLGAEIDRIDCLGPGDKIINKIALTGALGQRINLWVEAWSGGSDVASLVIQINEGEPIPVDIRCDNYPEDKE